MEDPFYNFDEMGENSLGVQSVLDPSNPNAIPFFDDCFSVSPPPSFSQLDEEEEGGEGVGFGGGVVAKFDPDLFNSILTTGDDILARLESTSSASGSVGSFEASPGMLDGGGDPAPVGVAMGVVSGGGGAVMTGAEEEDFDDHDINRPGKTFMTVSYELKNVELLPLPNYLLHK